MKIIENRKRYMEQKYTPFMNVISVIKYQLAATF